MVITDLMEKTNMQPAIAYSFFADGAFHAARVGGLEVRSHFQAIIEAKSLGIAGHEALLRANLAEGETLSPQAAFHVARYEDRLVELDRVSRTLHVMNYLGYPVPDDTLLFLNVNPGLVTTVSDHGEISALAAERSGFPRERIVIEIVENAATSNKLLERAVWNYRQRGFLVAIDDFGAEHSNLDRLWRLKPDLVKVDGGLFRDMSTNDSAAAILTKLIDIIHEVDARAVIEGIETAAQAHLAIGAGADLLQGYFFDKPSRLPRQI